jgi:hypothetical protein
MSGNAFMFPREVQHDLAAMTTGKSQKPTVMNNVTIIWLNYARMTRSAIDVTKQKLMMKYDYYERNRVFQSFRQRPHGP